MRYRVSCYNGGPLLGLDWVFIKPDEAIIEVDANNENEAINNAKLKVDRDYYKVIGITG
jgi:hypothetical protein